MPFMNLLAAYDTDANANDVKLPPCHVAPDVICLDLRNAMLPLITLSAS